jgi:hypothetical protein
VPYLRSVLRNVISEHQLEGTGSLLEQVKHLQLFAIVHVLIPSTSWQLPYNKLAQCVTLLAEGAFYLEGCAWEE